MSGKRGVVTDALTLVWPTLERLPIERFTTLGAYGEREALRYRIDLR